MCSALMTVAVLNAAPCEASPALVDELDEGQAGVLLDGVLPLLNIEDKKNFQ